MTEQTNAVRHRVVRVDRDMATDQSWDVLEGETWGPVPLAKVHDEIAEAQWREVSPHFTPSELACKGTDLVFVYVPALIALNDLREKGVIRATTPTSAYRSPAHNADVGGARTSRHMFSAFDIRRRAITISMDSFLREARTVGFNGFGFYRTFVHMDFRARPQVWGKP